MARPRKSDKHLPPCVYLNHGAYYHVRAGKWARLGSELPAALAEYGRLFGAVRGTMPELIGTVLAYLRPRLAKSTYAQYAIAAKKLQHIFAEYSPEQVQAKHVAQVKVALAATPNMANRVLSFLRQVFDYAVEQQLVPANPAIGIKRHAEAKRTRLLTPDERDRILAHCGPRLRCVVELCYLTGQRIRDVLGIRVADLLDDGIAFRQQKTGARLIVRWTPELRATVERAKALGGNVRALTLLYNRRGKAPDYRTIADQWRAACAAAGVEDANLHDLRAAAATAVGRAQAGALLGHASEANTARYLRSKDVPIVDGPGRVFGAK
jgi:integrase